MQIFLKTLTPFKFPTVYLNIALEIIRLNTHRWPTGDKKKKKRKKERKENYLAFVTYKLREQVAFSTVIELVSVIRCLIDLL